MKQKVISFLIIAILFLSCSTKKQNYKLIRDFLNDETANKLFQKESTISNKLDTIYIAKDLINISKIKKYSLNWETINSQNPFYMGVKIIWIDTINKISLSQKEISYMRNQMIQEDNLIWDLEKFDSKKIILIDSNGIFNDINNKYYYGKTNKKILINYFTKPIYNKQKDIALIGFYNGFNLINFSGSKFCMLILKKVNGNWTLIGFERDIGLRD